MIVAYRDKKVVGVFVRFSCAAVHPGFSRRLTVCIGERENMPLVPAGAVGSFFFLLFFVRFLPSVLSGHYSD
jgi:hypothetical protein